MLLNDILVRISIFIIVNLHQKIISPILKRKGARCRFYPSCSEYGVLALKKYGFIKGCQKTISRVRRCRVDNFDSCIDFP